MKFASQLVPLLIALGCAGARAPEAKVPEPENVPAQGLSAPRLAASRSPSEARENEPTISKQPDLRKLQAYLDRRIRYPASAGQVLDSCSLNPELTEGERQWISENLPQGVYSSAVDVSEALTNQ